MTMAKTEMTWVAVLAEMGCYDFLDPVVSQAVDEAIRLNPDAAPLVSDDAQSDLRSMCLSRLGLVYERPILQLAIKRAGLSGLILLNTKDEARTQMMRRIARGVHEELADGNASLRARLPNAADYERAVADNFTEATAEFLERLLIKRDEVSQKLLGGRPVTRITGISANGAHPHCRGRMVMRIETDAGQFYYKPHDCRLDALYLELTGAWFSDCARTAELVLGDGYAFVELLAPQELSREEDLRTYWRNFGCLAALFYGLGSRDMKQDNVMCCGLRPAALDLEALLAGDIAVDASVTMGIVAFEDIPADLIEDSVFTTSILPIRASRNTVSPLVADNASGTCLPRLHGVRRTVQGFEQDFSEGFEDGYRRLARHRNEVLAVLQRYGDATCRQILLNTWPYSKTRALLFSPQAMADWDKHDEVLEALNAQYGMYPAELRREVAAPDAAALEVGDIPYYCSHAVARTLYSGEGHAVGEFLARSALEVATHRLERLSEDELRFELDLIRRCLATDSSSGSRL